MMPYQLNIEAILTAHFPCAKEELIQDAAEMICKLKNNEKVPAEKVARWIPNFRYGMYPNEKFFICPDCNKQSMEYGQYCPNCGEKREIK